jgi:hypothetical protein
MTRERYVIIEFLFGVILLAVGAVIYWWKNQLIWILIYPPPIEKQVLDVVPCIFWIVGFTCTADYQVQVRISGASSVG